MIGEFGERMDTCNNIVMAESFCCPPETIKTLFIGYSPIQNEKFKTNKKIFKQNLHSMGEKKKSAVVYQELEPVMSSAKVLAVLDSGHIICHPNRSSDHYQ